MKKKLTYPAMTPADLDRVGRVEWSELERPVAAFVARRPAEPQAGGAAGDDAPPLLTGGEHPEEPRESIRLVLSDGKVKVVEKRETGDGELGFVDTLNFTVGRETAVRLLSGLEYIDTLSMVVAMSGALESIFGFGVAHALEGKRNFYSSCWELGDGYGMICFNHNIRDNILVVLHGEGCHAARKGWENRLVWWLENKAVDAKLTRIDVAHDLFEGGYTPHDALRDYQEGGFRLSRSPKNPECEQRGNWQEPNGKGLTFYVGLRRSGKYCRIYEKGKQLGDESSPWVRIEVEFKSTDRVLTTDMLLHPGRYLAGAYPAFGWLTEKQERIATVRNSKVVEKQAKEDWIGRVAGKDLAVLWAIEDGETLEERAVNLLKRIQDESKLPKWALLPDSKFAGVPIHRQFSGVEYATPRLHVDAYDIF